MQGKECLLHSPGDGVAGALDARTEEEPKLARQQVIRQQRLGDRVAQPQQVRCNARVLRRGLAPGPHLRMAAAAGSPKGPSSCHPSPHALPEGASGMNTAEKEPAHRRMTFYEEDVALGRAMGGGNEGKSGTSLTRSIMRRRKAAKRAGAARTSASHNMSWRAGLVARQYSSLKAARRGICMFQRPWLHA